MRPMWPTEPINLQANEAAEADKADEVNEPMIQ